MNQANPESKVIFDNLVIESSGTRPQLTTQQKRDFSEAVAKIAAVDPNWIDIRTLSDEKQTARSISESNGAKRNASIPLLNRVFVMRCTGEAATYEKIARYMDANVQRAGGIGIMVGADPEWHVERIYFDKRKEKEAALLAEYFLVPKDKRILIETPSGAESSSFATRALEDIPDLFIDKDFSDDVLGELARKKCIILQGPPGTGKTTLATALAKAFVGDGGNVTAIQFHAGYSYDDFIQGWRPNGDGFELAAGHFMEICETARLSEDKNHVLIIDEINRGNVSAVFGECFSLIESTKRSPVYGMNLAYKDPNMSAEEFYVPPNVYIIGTMNTADRSLAIVDYALRRRFSFVSIPPAFGDENFASFLVAKGLPSAFVKEVFLRLNSVNEAIRSETRSLGAGFEIGHSYFCPSSPPTDHQAWYRSIIVHEIGPLLREYWFDSPETAASYEAQLLKPFPIEVENGTAPITEIE